MVTMLPLLLMFQVTFMAQQVASATQCDLRPQAVYSGSNPTPSQPVLLRIANGGAGQSGLIGAWANAFIDWCVQKKQLQSFSVAWYLGDTTQSLGFLSEGTVDIAVTYNDAAEQQRLKTGEAVQRVYGFRDHFYLVGPKANPAGLINASDTVFDMFNKIVTLGNRDVATPPQNESVHPVRFLSRFDKSATNIKESEIFIAIGQVPWALTYSVWYHQYPQFPLQALQAATFLSEYTLTDRGTWLSASNETRDILEIYKRGLDEDPNDPLLNPARVLLGSKAKNETISKLFMDWVIDRGEDGGQAVIDRFIKFGEVLYSRAP